MTKRRLETTLNERETDENSVLYRHSCLTNHEINYSNPCIFTKGVHYFRFRIKVANPTSIQIFKWILRFTEAETLVVLLIYNLSTLAFVFPQFLSCSL